MQRRTMLALAAAMLAAPAWATPANPTPGKEYTLLSSRQPVQTTGTKVEVIEFFAYHCPACYDLEDDLLAWVKKQGDRVAFRRIPYPFLGANDPEARMFLALSAMGVEDAMHPRVLRAMHVDRMRVRSDEDVMMLIGRIGVDKAAFTAAYNSFGVQSKLRSLARTAEAYRSSGTPYLVIDGRFATTPAMVAEATGEKSREGVLKSTLTVMDALLDKALK